MIKIRISKSECGVKSRNNNKIVIISRVKLKTEGEYSFHMHGMPTRN